MRVLLVTNDFPPRVGGIQNYLWNIYSRFDPSDVAVLAPAFPGDVAYDRSQPFAIHRWPGRVYWPTPALKRRIRELAKDHRADAVAFGAVLPMNAIDPGVPTIIHTHGFEVAWARVPGLVQMLRKIGARARLVTVVSEYTRRFIVRALGSDVPVELLRTGVDLERFNPGADGSEVRKRHGLAGKPVVAHVSRLVARKGQDVLIRAMPLVRREVPDATALIVGGGSDEARLRRLAFQNGVTGAVAFAGEVGEDALAAHYAAGDVFAMPCRSRWADLEVEGLGLVYLEAQACARPAIAGDSGGAPEAVVPGETGFVVPGRDHRALAERLTELLGDPSRARAMGEAGRRFVEANHRWDDVVARYRSMLDRA
ncbi:MAG: glycosyltransferase family 4 protein [Actinomycetota bacterium]